MISARMRVNSLAFFIGFSVPPSATGESTMRHTGSPFSLLRGFFGLRSRTCDSGIMGRAGEAQTDDEYVYFTNSVLQGLSAHQVHVLLVEVGVEWLEPEVAQGGGLERKASIGRVVATVGVGVVAKHDGHEDSKFIVSGVQRAVRFVADDGCSLELQPGMQFTKRFVLCT